MTKMKNPLLSDLDQIEKEISDKGQRELIEWNRGLVLQLDNLVDRVSGIEAAVDELTEGSMEGLSTETASILLSTLQQANIVVGTFHALIDSESNPLDDMSTKRTRSLLDRARVSIAESLQLVQDLVIEEEEGEDGYGSSDDGSADDGDDGDDGDQESTEEEAQQQEEVVDEDGDDGEAHADR